MKLPFTWSLSRVWQTATNTIRTTLNLAEKPKKGFATFAETSKTGVQSKYFCDVFRQKTHELSIVIAKSMKLPFTWISSSRWQNNTNTIRTTLNLTEKSKKKNVFLLKRQKLGSNQSNIATFSDKKLTNFQSSLQRVWNYLSHEYRQVDGKTTQTPSERLWTWPKNKKILLFFC